MNIGIDIDDTLSESLELLIPFSQKFDIEELGNAGQVQKYGKVEDHYCIETMYSHWTTEETDLFWEKIFGKVVTEARPKPYASEILHRLRKEGNKIVIITSRYEVFPNDHTIENETKKWFVKNDIPFDAFVLNAQDKLIAAKNEKIDLFIDDSIQHCRNVQSGGIKSLVYTSIGNQGVELSDLERVYSWIQVYDKYKKMLGK